VTTNKTNQIVKINVDKSFARVFKIKSIQSGCNSMLEYSRKVAKGEARIEIDRNDEQYNIRL